MSRSQRLIAIRFSEEKGLDRPELNLFQKLGLESRPRPWNQVHHCQEIADENINCQIKGSCLGPVGHWVNLHCVRGALRLELFLSLESEHRELPLLPPHSYFHKELPLDKCHVTIYIWIMIKTFADRHTKELYESGKSKRLLSAI